MTSPSEFWDILAPHHAALENSYFDLPSLRRILNEIRPPVLVVGAGQGLIVEGLQKKGFRCDGLDLSSEMVRYAKDRRGLTLVQGNANTMPFGDQTYATVLYATGVIDFIGDEQEIRNILIEGRRVVRSTGKLLIAFYRFSRAGEAFLKKVGLLKNNRVSLKQSMEVYLLNPIQMIAWVAKRANVSYGKAMAMLLRLAATNSLQEKAVTIRMQRIFRNPETAQALLRAAPESQPYRDEAEIRNLLGRLQIPLKRFYILDSCCVAEIC